MQTKPFQRFTEAIPFVVRETVETYIPHYERVTFRLGRTAFSNGYEGGVRV
jgi:hypothetical protein